MATMAATPAATPDVQKILGGKGSKLHTHELHIRHADNGGYIAKHDLRDKHGNAPHDGQRASIETQHPNMDALKSMLEQNMQQGADGQPAQAGDDEEPQGA